MWNCETTYLSLLPQLNLRAFMLLPTLRLHVPHAGFLLGIFLLFIPAFCYAQGTPDQPSPADTPPEERHLRIINVKGQDLRDVLRGIGQEAHINLVVDNRIDQKVTTHLADIPAMEAIQHLCRQYGLNLVRSGRIWRIEKPPEPPPAPPPPLAITIADDLLSYDLNDADLARVVRTIVEQTSLNIVLRSGVRGTISGLLRDVPLQVGLETMMTNNGFAMREKDGIFHLDRVGMEVTENGQRGRRFWVQVQDSLITLDVTDAPIQQVLREISNQMDIQLFTYTAPEGNISAKVSDLTLEDALSLLLKNTNATFREQDGVYLIGSKQTDGFSSTKLIRLDHIISDTALELLPSELTENATIQVVKEHNGLTVTASQDVIAQVEQFIDEVDHPTPQILIEALVLDVNTTDLFNAGITFGNDAQRALPAADGHYMFGDGESKSGGFNHRGGKRLAQKYLDALGSMVGLSGAKNLGKLPENFFFEINALSREGKVNIISRPQIAALNGSSSSLSFGTTQYFILDTSTPYPSTNQVYVQQAQRFEQIEAKIGLEVTPWVSASGEVTVDIRPEFSSPVGEFDPEVPPTINSRVLDSTVRLRDGETIILGGLIQDKSEVVLNKVPFLGSIPLLGRLFRNQSHDTSKSELIIFLTPHVFYGNEDDNSKWIELTDQLDLDMPRDTTGVGYTRWKR